MRQDCPRNPAQHLRGHVDRRLAPCESARDRIGQDTTGLKCAPEMDPKARIEATSAAPVAMVFASRVSARLPPESRSAIIPEPTTAATRKAVPRNSATTRLGKLDLIDGRSSRLLF